ncbi:hypothetical protein NEDG_01314 [Nematocida displodere]|uniref:Uncharacterized protein n=1 Tax=Nematocida displodere TaxID=1805483 RepID=A0A177ECJ5_9MICR|nr:hypothetical protein NEDG_01314 [Nematocida displodere]
MTYMRNPAQIGSDFGSVLVAKIESLEGQNLTSESFGLMMVGTIVACFLSMFCGIATVLGMCVFAIQLASEHYPDRLNDTAKTIAQKILVYFGPIMFLCVSVCCLKLFAYYGLSAMVTMVAAYSNSHRISTQKKTTAYSIIAISSLVSIVGLAKIGPSIIRFLATSPIGAFGVCALYLLLIFGFANVVQNLIYDLKQKYATNKPTEAAPETTDIFKNRFWVVLFVCSAFILGAFTTNIATSAAKSIIYNTPGGVYRICLVPTYNLVISVFQGILVQIGLLFHSTSTPGLVTAS